MPPVVERNNNIRRALFLMSDPSQLIEFDAMVTENHKGDVAITDHPVEDGVDISDHARPLPESVSVRVIVSDDPIIANRSENAQPSVPGGDPDTRSNDAYDFVKRFKDGVSPVGLATTLRDYSNMLISSMSVVKDAATGRVLDLNLTLREIQKANTRTTEVPEPVNPSRKKETTQGKKQKREATPAVEEKTQSISIRLGRAIGRAISG